MPKMFGFYPIICGNKDFGNPSYRWDEDSKTWKKINGKKIKRQKHIMSISLKEVDLKKLNG